MSRFEGHNFGRCRKCGKFHHRPDGFSGHNWDGVCKKCGQFHGSSPIAGYQKQFQIGHPYLSNWSEHNWGNCEKCGKYHKPPMQGRHHTEESRKKSSEANKVAHRTPEMRAKKSADAKRQWQNPEIRAHARRSIREHHEAVVEEARKLREQGYEVFETDLIRPDALAKKDGKLFAVEVDFDKNTNHEKYAQTRFFDDVVWIQREHVHHSAVCQQCGKTFDYEIPSSNRKFCSHKCYGVSINGKLPVEAMKARGLM